MLFLGLASKVMSDAEELYERARRILICTQLILWLHFSRSVYASLLVLLNLHIPNGVIHRPLTHQVEIPANMLRVELRPSQRIIFDHVQGKNPNVGVALDVQAEYFNAMICS